MNIETRLNEILSAHGGAREGEEGKGAVLKLLKELPPDVTSLNAFRRVFEFIDAMEDEAQRRQALLEFVRTVPKTGDFSALFAEAMERAVEAVEANKESPIHKKSSYMRLAGEVPHRAVFSNLYASIMRRAIDIADRIEDRVIRRHSLVEIAKNLRDWEGLEPLSLHALRVALGFAEGAGYKKYSLDEIARELPKSCDETFYIDRTFLGVTRGLPKRGEFLELYKKAIDFAIKAAVQIEEPYYRKYALLYIADELAGTEQFISFYKNAFREAFNATLAIKDPFTRLYGLIELLKKLPKTEEFFPLVSEIIETCLPFFSVRSRMQDVEMVDVIDYVIVAEEKRINESKKRRYTREKYAQLFARELEDFSDKLNDIRLIETLKPYAHVWIKPVVLRDAVKKAVAHLNELKERYHGREIERPVFVREVCPDYRKDSAAEVHSRTSVRDTISIDLGATNTVIMRKRGDAMPDFVHLDAISRKYGDTYIVPTLIEPETDAIGAEAQESASAVNMKKMLLEGDPGGRELMDRYFRILYRHLKEANTQTGLFSRLSGRLCDRLCVTVPVGFHGYRKALAGIIKKSARNIPVEFVEEPLAAAIGYQVAEEKDKLFMVLDFGGCTLDIMLLRLNIDEVHVVAKPDRSRMLGGKDIDRWLAEYLAERCGLVGREIPPRLLTLAEEIKIALSEYRRVPFVWDGREVCKVTRDDFEEVLDKHDFYRNLDREISYVLKKAKKVGVTGEMIDAVLLTGGSSQIPSFRDKIAHTFPELGDRNAIYDHSPLTAVARGAVMYGTSDVIDRHLGMAYAVRFSTKGKERPHSYEIILEKGESLPIEKTFSIKPARTLGAQREMYLEIFEVPENLVTRRWVRESGMEFIKQVIKHSYDEVELHGFKAVTLSFDEPVEEDIEVTFCVDASGAVRIRYGRDGKEVPTELRLQ